MPRQLPDNPNLEHLKNQAKALLRAGRDSDSDACDLLKMLPRFSSATNSEILASDIALHECQHAIALSYGFRSWPALRAFLLSNANNDQEEISMSLIHKDSLAKTLDAFEETVFYGQKLARSSAEELARWIVSGEGKGWSYQGLPAPTVYDIQHGFYTFTGERFTSRASTSHMLGEEAARALAILDVDDTEVRNALALAVNNVSNFSYGEPDGGFFCCGKCSIAMWRFLCVSPADNAESRIAKGVRVLSSRRDGEGKWNAFPFYYTLLGLSGIPEESARPEMQYAAPVCERLLKRNVFRGKYGQRRHDLLERILGKC